MNSRGLESQFSLPLQLAQHELERRERYVAAVFAELCDVRARYASKSAAFDLLMQQNSLTIDNSPENAANGQTARAIAEQAVAHRARERKIAMLSRELGESGAQVRFAEIIVDLRRQELQEQDAIVQLLKKHQANELTLMKRRLLQKEELDAEFQLGATPRCSRRT